jgi:nucleoid-associated protein YgaU
LVNNPSVNNPSANNPLVNNSLVNNLPAPPVIDAKTSVPPIPAPGRPQVRDSETINYTIKGGETLEAISKARYGSEKYAKAILAYNREFSPTGKL